LRLRPSKSSVTMSR